MSEPARPVAVLRIAVAGNRKLADEPALQARADALFDAMEHALFRFHATHIGPGAREGARTDYVARTPALRLVSGLADGVDQVLTEAFLGRASGAPEAPERSVAAILPFEVDVYRDKSRIANVERFERLLDRCRYVIELDGTYADGTDGDEVAAKQSREAAYRTQSAILTRQADILVAVEDPAAEGSGGGTRETIIRALHIGVPVIRLRLPPKGKGAAADEAQPEVLLELEDLYRHRPDRCRQRDLDGLVRKILAPPRTAAAGETEATEEAEEKERAGATSRVPESDRGLMDERRAYERQLLDEFFSGNRVAETLTQKLWQWFERRFRKRGERMTPDPVPARFVDWRMRARNLSAHYAGRYRGTFLLNFGLAVFAVFLAVGSLVILILEMGAAGTHAPGDHGLGWWTWSFLTGFGLCKLAVLVRILTLTSRANKAHWNEKAIDFRYLAERLRSMAYMPAVGSLRTLPPRSAGYATRASTQRMVDWLFAARVREVSPEEIMPAYARPGWIRLDPREAAGAIHQAWIGNQAQYHARNEATMSRMNHWLEKAGARMNKFVIGVVALDLLFLAADLAHLPEGLSAVLHGTSPWLLFLAAILPAAIASLNGIRFQSECARLSDRSTQMRWMLAGLDARAEKLIMDMDAPPDPARPQPGHTADVLKLAEDTAQVMLDEVSEWTFVYAKELVEP